MTVGIITGASGLIGSETVRHFARQGLDIVGIDNDMRRQFFGDDASTQWMRRRIEAEIKSYRHVDCDIRDTDALGRLFGEYGHAVDVVVHCAAQPSHDWAARDPWTDFSVNAVGTLNLLQLVRDNCPDAVFINMSTNKVYGDRPNSLPLVERETRWEIAEDHPYFDFGIDESMSIDDTTHSLFGVSKASGDLLVQEFGRYFDMKTACLRGGCLTGPAHSGAELHGFLSYLVRCAVTGTRYSVFGYKGKQVRDNIHSEDLAAAIWAFYRDPKVGRVYNMGGGRRSNCSIMEAIALCESHTGRPFNQVYVPENRIGDHIWWISDTRRFERDFPDWTPRYDTPTIIAELCEALTERDPQRLAAH